MRILIFDNSYDGRSTPKSGGDNIHSYEFSRFAGKKHAVRLVKWHFGKKLLVSNNRWGLEIVLPSALKKIPLLPFVGLLLLLVKESIRFNAHVIIAYKAYPNGLPASIAARLTGRCCLIRPSGADLYLRPKQRFPRLWISITAKYAEGLLCITRWMKKICDQFGGNSYIVAGGVDTKRFKFSRKRQLPDKGRKIAYIGRLEPQKDVQMLARIITALPCHKFIVVGEGKLKALVTSLKTKNLSQLGAMPHEKIPEILRMSDFLILPSEYEGLSNVLLEAYAIGTVVVCSDVIGNREIVKHGKTGYLCKSYPDFIRVLDSKETARDYARITKNARKIAESHDIDRYMAQLEVIALKLSQKK